MRAGFKVVSFYWNKGEKICVPLIELDSIIIYEFFLGKRSPPVGLYPFFIVTEQEWHYTFDESEWYIISY